MRLGSLTVPAAQASFRVFDGGNVVDESVRRPLRMTPDGYAGVAYGGAGYPLMAGDVVDISGSSWEIEDCNRFLLTGAVVPYALADMPRRLTAPRQVLTLSGNSNRIASVTTSSSTADGAVSRVPRPDLHHPWDRNPDRGRHRRRDRRRHDPVPHRGAPGVLGRDLPQRHPLATT